MMFLMTLSMLLIRVCLAMVAREYSTWLSLWSVNCKASSEKRPWKKVRTLEERVCPSLTFHLRKKRVAPEK